MLKLLATVSLAAVLALGVAGTSPALADIIWHEVVDGDHFYNVYDDKGNFKFLVVYDKDHKYKGTFGSNPNPEGGSTGLVDHKSLIEEAMKNGGGEYIPREDFLGSPLGRYLSEKGKTIVPVHNPADFNPGAFQPGENGGGGAGGGFDPMGGSIVDQMKKNGSKNKNNGNDDGGSDGGKQTHAADQFPGLMELVNPVPIPVAKPLKNKVQHIAPRTLAPKPAQTGGLRTALTNGGILGGGPSLLPGGPTATGIPLVSGVGSPLGSTLR